MAPGDALDDEMRRHLRNSVPPLDADTAERMLDGALDPLDAPPDYRDVLWVLAAASAPASADPSAEAAALATFRSARRPVDTRRRTSVLSKMLGAKALAALALGTASIGTVAAAATGTLPDAAQAAVHRVVAAAPSADRAEGAGDAGSAKAAAGSHSAADLVGLCRAYAAGRGGEQGRKLDAAAFKRLTEAAGSADLDAYCATVTAGARADSATRAGGGKTDADLAGHCRSWLAAGEQDRAKLGKPVLDRLTAAAGGADSIAAYCSALVGQATADQGAATNPRPTTATAPASPGADAPGRDASPSHPAPTPRG